MTKSKGPFKDNYTGKYSAELVEIEGIRWLYGEFELENGDIVTYMGRDMDEFFQAFIDSMDSYEEFSSMDGNDFQKLIRKRPGQKR